MQNSFRSAELLLLASTLVGLILAPLLLGQQRRASGGEAQSNQKIEAQRPVSEEEKLEIANFGAGCFWCVEAVFQELQGVVSVESGYMGGDVDQPTYQQVCTGTTGHAEICQIKFDPGEISFKELLEVFWKTHDPTTLNQQGADTGTQYRSAIFFTSEEQRQSAEHFKQRLDESGAFNDKIVTEITEATEFFPAGDYHADYYRRNPGAGYCQFVIAPKVDKFKKAFADKLKPN